MNLPAKPRLSAKPRHTELVIAVIALVLSTLALAISAMQYFATLKHNRLSVRPYIQATFYLEGPGGRSGLYVENVGLGTGIFTGFTIKANGKNYSALGNPNVWKNIMTDLKLPPACFLQSWPEPQAGIKVADERPFLTATRKNLPMCDGMLLLFLSNKDLEITISYTSLYGESYTTTSKSWVHRYFLENKLPLP